MAFSSLDLVRTAKLNVELGLTSDADDRFGTDDVRNYALQDAIRRLWPRMARLTRETVTPLALTFDYTLSTVRDVAKIEQLDSENIPISDLAGNWRVWYDEEDATPVVRLLLAHELSTETTLRVIGYAPYTVPTSSPPSSSGSINIQPEDEWVIVAGARAFLYGMMLNTFMVYERHENENRKTFLTPEQLLGMQADAERKFQTAIDNHRRRMIVGVKARLNR